MADAGEELVALAALHGKLQLVTYGVIDFLVRRGVVDRNDLVLHVDEYAKRRGHEVALTISDQLDEASDKSAPPDSAGRAEESGTPS